MTICFKKSVMDTHSF